MNEDKKIERIEQEVDSSLAKHEEVLKEIKEERKEIHNVEKSLINKEEKIKELERKTISEEERLIAERKEKVLRFFKTRTSWIYYGILFLILVLNTYIRILPMKIRPETGKPGLWDVTTDTWTLGPDLDPFLFLRYAKQIVANGTLSAIDYMRSTPLGFDTAKETQLLPYMIAYFHKVINFFGDFSVDYAGILFPAIASIFTAIFFFLLVKKFFEHKGVHESNVIALAATFLMVLLPSLLPRTIAGIPEKESIGFCFMFASFYFFLSAFNAKKTLSALIFGVFAGLFTSALANVWGGVSYVYATIAIYGFMVFLLERMDKEKSIGYGTWLITTIIFGVILSPRADLRSFLVTPISGFATFNFILIIIDLIFSKTKIKDLTFFNKPSIKKIPKPILIVLLSLILIFIISIFTLGYSTLWTMGKSAIGSLNPVANRLISTVAENKPTSFGDWKEAMGPVVKNTPLFFLLFFIGSLVIFYEMIIPLKIKEKILMTVAYAFFLYALIFDKEGNTFSRIIEISSYLILFITFAYIYYKEYMNQEDEIFRKININYLLIFVFIFLGIIGTRNGIRFMMVLTPIAVIPATYLGLKYLFLGFKSKDNKKILFWILAIIFIGILIIPKYGVLPNYYATSKNTAYYNVPSSYSHQWQYAMQWVRNNTPENAVFGHWWDYGYWLQSIGNRATMLDGGNVITYWNYLMGRHVLTAESEQEALNVLYNHNVTHYLIDSTEIGKYSAYSLIGSDEKYDRFSWIGTFLMDEKSTQEAKDKTIYVYTGGNAIDQDLIVKENNGQIILPAQGAAIGALLIPVKANNTFEQPSAVYIYNNKQYNLPLRYVFVNGKLIDFGTSKENTIDGCAYLFPRVDSGKISEIGASMYLSPRNMKALWIRLYLLGEGKNFELVHSEPSAVHRFMLNPNNIVLPEIVYYQGVQGPIKIWEIKYTGKETLKEEYLRTDFPQEIAERSIR